MINLFGQAYDRHAFDAAIAWYLFVFAITITAIILLVSNIRKIAYAGLTKTHLGVYGFWLPLITLATLVIWILSSKDYLDIPTAAQLIEYMFWITFMASIVSGVLVRLRIRSLKKQ